MGKSLDEKQLPIRSQGAAWFTKLLLPPLTLTYPFLPHPYSFVLPWMEHRGCNSTSSLFHNSNRVGKPKV